MKKYIVGFLGVVFFTFLGACGGGGGDTSGVTTTLSPIEAATDQALDVAVTATFSGDITAPSDWLTVFTLKAGGTGDTLCTAVAYDSSTRIAICTHPNLARNTNYTASVSGLTDANDKAMTSASASFTTTTAEASVVSAMSKTSNASATDGSGSVDLTFTFSAAVPASTTPTVSVAASTSANIAEGAAVKASAAKAVSGGTCTFNSDRTACTSTITGLDGCKTFTDYTVTVSGGNVTEYTARFNSADDEFDTPGTIAPNAGDSGYCWSWEAGENQDPAGTVSHSLTSDGRLKIEFAVDGEGNINQEGNASKSIGASDFAVSVYVTANDYATTGGASEGFQMGTANNASFGIENQHSTAQGFGQRNTWEVFNTNDNNAYAAPAGSLAATATTKAPFYVCIVRYNGLMLNFISFDGSSYTALSTDNMAATAYSDVADTVSILNGTAVVADPTELTQVLVGAKNYGITPANYYAEIDYVRFKSSGLTGAASDCPAF